MSLLTIEVEIEHGRLTPREAHLLPAKGHGLLTLLTPADAASEEKFSVVIGADGLPIIRAAGTRITSAQVREIEGLAS